MLKTNHRPGKRYGGSGPFSGYLPMIPSFVICLVFIAKSTLFCSRILLNIYTCSLISDGRQEAVHFDKITSRICKLCYNLNMDFIDPVRKVLKMFGMLCMTCAR